MNKQQLLTKYWGFSSFKPLQEDIITSILEGNDTLALLPTGGGKSLCYQLPALLMEGTALVISPLIALMEDQVKSLEDRGIKAMYFESHPKSLTLSQQIDNCIYGNYKVVYTSPERLTNDIFLQQISQAPLSLIAVDEAHCISEWGHDFRPEYRNLRSILEQFEQVIPIIALTATATPKVQEDIMKNLRIKGARLFKASFNRPNLYYEVRSKTSQVDSDIIRFIKQNSGKSGIIYCLSRKRVEELAQTLQVNGVDALPYHAGLDSKSRVNNQDKFLKDDCDVIVATIAFGMGIDKPDVRFVIHHDIPKSLESYYQETGRAGRDGGEGHCLAFYAYKDIEKLEKFMSGKPLAEQEIGMALLADMVAYAETSLSRRKYILHYFGEEFDNDTGEGGEMDDNMRFPKKQFEAQSDLQILLETILATKEHYKAKEVVKTLMGEKNALIQSHKTHEISLFGKGAYKDAFFWMALIRQALVGGFLLKEIETYGLLRITSRGKDFLSQPESFLVSEDHKYDALPSINIIQNKSQGVLDSALMKLLISLRKDIAKKNQVPPYAVFQEYSLEEMCLKYPINSEELVNINGVGEGKAKRYGTRFLELINSYVEDNQIVRPNDLIVKSTGINSSLKLYLIQSVDRKLPLEDIASAKGMNMEKLVAEMETIVFAGTKLNIDYCMEDLFDEDQIEELYDYFIEADSDSIKQALEEFDGDFDEEELRLYRLKFMSEIAN